MALSLTLLKDPNFRLLVGVRFCCHFALQALAVIVGWQIYSLTKSELLLGLIGLTEAIPAIVGSFFSGYVVDISTPQRVYTACIAALIINTAFLLGIGGEFFDLPHTTLVPLLFLGMFTSGIARSFMMPSYFSLTPQIVDRKDYAVASAWGNAGFQTALILGPLVAGCVYGFYGVRAAWFLPVSFMTLGFLCVINFKHLRPYDKPDHTESAFQTILEGWHFVIRHRMLLTIMAVDMFAVLFGGAVAMLPAYADKILHVGPEGLGILRMAPALGAIFAAIFFAVRPMKNFPLTRMLWAVAAFGVCMIGFGLSTSFALSVIFLAFSGLFDTISALIRTTLKQLLTPDHMRGRVAGISAMFIISSNEIGAFESGVAARAMGLVPSVVFGGVMSILVVATTYILTPRLRRMMIDDKTDVGATHHGSKT